MTSVREVILGNSGASVVRSCCEALPITPLRGARPRGRCRRRD